MRGLLDYEGSRMVRLPVYFNLRSVASARKSLRQQHHPKRSAVDILTYYS
jgi:hypothetical protein